MLDNFLDLVIFAYTGTWPDYRDHNLTNPCQELVDSGPYTRALRRWRKNRAIWWM